MLNSGKGEPDRGNSLCEVGKGARPVHIPGRKGALGYTGLGWEVGRGQGNGRSIEKHGSHPENEGG